LIPFIGIFLVLPPIIPFIFGPEWEPVGNFVRIFTLMYYAKFVVTPVSYVSYIINKQKYYMFFQAMKFLSIILGLGIGFYTGNFYLGLILWSILLTVAYILIYFFSYRLVIISKYSKLEGDKSN
jgi:O-antigen/teichoic acid export membrane protein